MVQDSTDRGRMVPPGSLDGEAHFTRAKDSALRFLTYRARSEVEVRRRLSKKHHSPEVVEQVIETLLRQRFLDDSSFAQEWRLNRERHRPRAKRMVRQELRELGVSSEIIQDTLRGFDDEANAYDAGVKLARKLSARSFSEEEFRRRISSLLQRLGFSYDLIRGTVERLWGELGADSLHRQHDTEDNEKEPQTPNAKP